MKKFALQGTCVTILALTGMVHPVVAQSDRKPLEFSADAVQSLPGAEIQTGKLFVSQEGTRFEYQQHGRPIIQIILPGKGLKRLIFPLQRAYMEYKSQAGQHVSMFEPATPCRKARYLKCDKAGSTKINGMDAERWSISSQRSPVKMRVWWDAKRHIALRQEYSDGRIMQATLRGMQKFEDRDVEHWEFIYTYPNGRFQRAMSLISPELGLAVIEQLPNGAIRRLHNIKQNAPDAKLFDIPKGYKLIPQPRPNTGTQRDIQKQLNGFTQAPLDGRAETNQATAKPPATAPASGEK